MSGKFNNIDNGICLAYGIIVPIAVIFVGVGVCLNAGFDRFDLIITVIPVFVISLLPMFLLRKCAFSADNEKVVFRVAFLKRTYSFSEIKSASTQVGFVHGKYGASARVELVITLSDGECFKYCDDNVPDDALSTPENHKKFQDTHQFTALCKYINERASG